MGARPCRDGAVATAKMAVVLKGGRATARPNFF
jgi:hypothetical protein